MPPDVVWIATCLAVFGIALVRGLWEKTPDADRPVLLGAAAGALVVLATWAVMALARWVVEHVRIV